MSRVIANPKELILGKAKEILYDQGYHKLSMRALSKACEIALGTIYNYYPTKKDLIIEMMMEYWQSFLNSVETVATSNQDIYHKLSNIFSELKIFIESFRQFWLTPELYDSPEYVEGGLKEENIFIEKLMRMVKDMLEREEKSSQIHMKLGTDETANFIVLNFITMVQMPIFKYSSFEFILKELLKRNM